MVTAQNSSPSRSRTGEAVAVLGVALAFAGVVLTDTAGVSDIVTGFGVAFLIAGSTYALADESIGARLALAGAALVAAQLFFFGGILQEIGLAGLAAVVAISAYTRYS